MVELSIIIPAYNEELVIERTINSYINFFRKRKLDFEINIILNGCIDNSAKIISNLAKKNKEIKFIDIKEPIGKGGAVIEGFKIARGDLLCYVDADGSTSPEALNDLLGRLGQNHGIMASRYVKGSKILNKQPIFRVAASRGFNILTRMMLSLNFK